MRRQPGINRLFAPCPVRYKHSRAQQTYPVTPNLRNMPSSPESFPSASQAALLLLASFLLEYLVGAGLYDARQALDLSPSQLNALVMLLANGLLLATVMHYRHMSYRDLLHPAKASATATALLVVPPVLLLVPMILLLGKVLNDLLLFLLPLSAWEEQAFTRMTAPNVASVVATCLLAPLLEEMLFRGVILRAFLHQYPRGTAIAASALYFGVAHLNVYQFALAFLLGLLLGWLFERSRSLLPCITLHACYNSWVVFDGLLAKAEAVHAAGDASPWSWLAALAAAAAGAFVLHRLLARGSGPVRQESRL
jgi:hypothetical protein